jgi:hypothetical protein
MSCSDAELNGTKDKESKRHIKETQSRHEGNAETFLSGGL